MRQLVTLLHVIDVVSEWTGKIVSFAIVPLIGIVLFWVVQREFRFATSFDYATTAKIFFVYVIFGAAYSLRVKAHVNVDILSTRLPPRARSVVDLVTAIFFFLFLVAMLWMAVETAVGSIHGFHLSLNTFWPQNWQISLLMPIGVALFLLQGLSKFIRDLIIAISGKKTP